jgi:hypothetical protein
MATTGTWSSDAISTSSDGALRRRSGEADAPFDYALARWRNADRTAILAREGAGTSWRATAATSSGSISKPRA